MTTNVGVWIDQARAHVVELMAGREPRVRTVESDVERRHRATGGGRAVPGHLHGSSAKRDDHRREQERQRHFERIIDLVAGADAVLLLGPGQAKRALRRQMERRECITCRIHDVVPADKKMTQAQLVAAVREHFAAASSIRPGDEPISHTPREHVRHGLREAARGTVKARIRLRS